MTHEETTTLSRQENGIEKMADLWNSTKKFQDAFYAEEKARIALEIDNSPEKVAEWRKLYRELRKVEQEEQDEKPEPSHWQGE